MQQILFLSTCPFKVDFYPFLNKHCSRITLQKKLAAELICAVTLLSKLYIQFTMSIFCFYFNFFAPNNFSFFKLKRTD